MSQDKTSFQKHVIEFRGITFTNSAEILKLSISWRNDRREQIPDPLYLRHVVCINVDICVRELLLYRHHVRRRGGQVRAMGLMSSHGDLFVG